MAFSAMLKTAFHDDTDFMAIRYPTEGKLVNLRRLQARSKMKDERMRDFLFADDCALNASSEDEMQRNMNTNKTEVMYQQHPTQATQIQP